MINAKSGLIILVAQDLFFLGRIDSLAAPLGFEVNRASSKQDFVQQNSATQPELILVDLECE